MRYREIKTGKIYRVKKSRVKRLQSGHYLMESDWVGKKVKIMCKDDTWVYPICARICYVTLFGLLHIVGSKMQWLNVRELEEIK